MFKRYTYFNYSYCGFVLFFYLSDAFESLFRYSREREELELDEILSVILISPFVLLWFSKRRIADFNSKEEDLKQSMQKYKNLIENSSDLVWEVDAQGSYTYISPRIKDMLGYESSELIGKTPFDLMSAEEAKRVGEIFGEIITSKASIINLISTNIHKNGTQVILETSGLPIFDEKGTLTGYQGISRDITERKQMEADIKLKDEMMIAQSRQAAMGDMIAMIAHQWRQPISIIGMDANNLKLDLELGTDITNEDLEDIADSITEQTQQLSQTIDDFRNFFKPNQEKKSTTVGAVLDSTMDIIRQSLENNNITVTIKNKSESELLTYPNHLLQVFLNILSNAKHILEDKAVKEAKIDIVIDESDDSVITSICDNGGGIAENLLKRLGEPYFTTKEKSGTGLGLYMSTTIVRKHLNRSLTWENRDEGACFIVTLPKE